MINNNSCSLKESQPLSREQAFDVLRKMSKDKLLDVIHIDHFNNLRINNGRRL